MVPSVFLFVYVLSLVDASGHIAMRISNIELPFKSSNRYDIYVFSGPLQGGRMEEKYVIKDIYQRKSENDKKQPFYNKTLKFDFVKWQGTYQVRFDLWEDVPYGFDRKLATEEFNITGKPRTLLQPKNVTSPDVSQSERKVFLQADENSVIKITVEYKIVCDMNWYGDNCTRLCKGKVWHCEGKRRKLTCREGTPGYLECMKGLEGADCSNGNVAGNGCEQKIVEASANSLCKFVECGTECRCVTRDGRGVCVCPEKKRVEVDPCTSQELCRNNSLCRNCSELGNNFCSSNPCLHGGNCTETKSGFQCSCPVEYLGRTCDHYVNICRRKLPCRNNGVCIEHEDAYVCKCRSGYIGKHCEHKNPCKFNLCRHGGTCHPQSSTVYACSCFNEYSGRHCEHLKLKCPKCENGGECTLSAQSKKLYCKCRSGYHGSLCQFPPVSCQKDYCRNGARCEAREGQRLCHCTENFTGLRCDKAKDACAAHMKCANGGTCTISSEGSAVCHCPQGFTGDRCQVSNGCSSSPCKNDGTCGPQGASGYTCRCRDGYVGMSCEEPISVCDIRDPCQNRGRCKNKGRHSPEPYNCLCISGFTGKNCEFKNPCATNNPCKNKGNCTSHEGEFKRCDCPPTYQGQFCEVDVDECRTEHCSGRGQCVNTEGGYHCKCQSGFYGRSCSVDINECLSGPCSNGGTCINHIGNYTCRCRPGYEGEQCTSSVVEARELTFKHFYWIIPVFLLVLLFILFLICRSRVRGIAVKSAGFESLTNEYDRISCGSRSEGSVITFDQPTPEEIDDPVPAVKIGQNSRRMLQLRESVI